MATLTEQIRQALARRDGISEDAMRSLAEAFSAEVDTINERLSKAIALLHKGLRSEAIQLASLNPSAIDAAAALDFPEFDDWCEILQFYGILTPNELRRDWVEELNEAIVESLPLEGFLRQHRRLAIARAPLAWRIKTLRKIAELDPGNGIWEDDLEIWEKARHQQIESEVRSALAAQDLAAMKSLQQELASQDWRIAPARSLMKPLVEALDQQAQQAAADQLQELAAQLHDAFCQFDETIARTAAQTWNDVRKRYRGPITAEWADQAEPALEWLRQMDEEAATTQARSAAVGRLQSCLETHSSRRDLEAAYNACSVFDEPPPELLVRQYRETIEQHQLRATRRNQAIITAILSTAAITVGGILFWHSSAKHQQTVRDAATNLDRLLAEKRLSDAQSLWSQLERDKPSVASDVTLVSLHARLVADVAADQQRAIAFASYLKQASVESADQMDNATLANAERIAVTEEEKAAAFKIRRQYNQWDREIAVQQTTALTAKVQEIDQELSDIERMPVGDVPVARMEGYERELASLARQFPRASEAAVALISPVQVRSREMRTAVITSQNRMQADRNAIRRIQQATSLADLGRVLQTVSLLQPDSTVGKQIQQVAAEAEVWESIQEWNSFVTKLGNSLSGGLTKSDAEKLAEQFNNIRSRLADNPAESRIQAAVQRIDQYPKRSELIQSQLGSLSQSVISDLYTVVTGPDGEGAPRQRRYVYKTYHDQNSSRWNKDWTGGRLNEVINAGGATESSPILRPPIAVAREPYETIQLLTSLTDQQNGQLELDWERELLRTVGKIRGREGLDWRLKEMLILYIIEMAAQGSPAFAQQTSAITGTLRLRSSERDTWFKVDAPDSSLPDDVESAVIRPLAELMREYPSAATLGQQASVQQYTWIGFFLPDDSMTMSLRQVVTPSQDGQLFVVVASAHLRKGTSLIEVGRIRNGQPTVKPNPDVAITGRPVFLLAN